VKTHSGESTKDDGLSYTLTLEGGMPKIAKEINNEECPEESFF
jgi:hypothetical protein